MDTSETIREFGVKKEHEERRDGGCGVVFDPESQRYAVGKKGEGGLLILFSGGVNSEEDIKDGVLREVVEESGLHDFLHVEKIGKVLCHYYNAAKHVDRVAHATCFLLILKSIDLVPTQLEEHEKFTLAWATPQEILSNWEARNINKDYDHWIYFFNKSVDRVVELGYSRSVHS
jgi:8-oxo-dGTP pyrophosphatase MutT (NUDIX family)